MTEAVCHGPSYCNCKNVVDLNYAFIPSAGRIGGKRPLTKAQLLAAAVCDDCAHHLERKGVRMYPLLDSLAPLLAAEVREREREASKVVSLGELLQTNMRLKNSCGITAAQVRNERNERRRRSAEQAGRFIAAAQRTPVAA